MKNKTAIFFAILAAIFYSLSIPISKLLLIELPSTMLAGLLYLGAGCGMSLLYPFSRLTKEGKEEASLEKSDIKYLLLMLLLDVIASVMLLFAVENLFCGQQHKRRQPQSRARALRGQAGKRQRSLKIGHNHRARARVSRA